MEYCSVFAYKQNITKTAETMFLIVFNIKFVTFYLNFCTFSLPQTRITPWHKSSPAPCVHFPTLFKYTSTNTSRDATMKNMWNYSNQERLLTFSLTPHRNHSREKITTAHTAERVSPTRVVSNNISTVTQVRACIGAHSVGRVLLYRVVSNYIGAFTQERNPMSAHGV